MQVSEGGISSVAQRVELNRAESSVQPLSQAAGSREHSAFPAACEGSCTPCLHTDEPGQCQPPRWEILVVVYTDIHRDRKLRKARCEEQDVSAGFGPADMGTTRCQRESYREGVTSLI